MVVLHLQHKQSLTLRQIWTTLWEHCELVRGKKDPETLRPLCEQGLINQALSTVVKTLKTKSEKMGLKISFNLLPLCEN